MAASIGTTCIRCGACEWECPTQAIRPGPERPVVDSATCTECFGFHGESQCMVVCPTGAITLDSTSTVELSALYTRLRPDRDPTDTDLWHKLEAPSVKLTGLRG
ncbi:4Fe-4S binding protein [Raineyella fluvialis]|uniref:4Fe-4S dicluster domain-containing protein n=1 Tax=Raineyella fluvialis TaxID=2662261 RepID=A0A5Q2F9W8_9ACTN|nr:4Fe-4S binding protein [Raineyella fluvialis]QGF23770.1 4Fe-4S dicluster domain-containing protein [Raineyella fluvialis]